MHQTTKTTITTPIQRIIPQCSAGSMNISTKLPTRNFYLETIGQFNINGLFLSGRCRYVSILHCFYRDEPNADRQDSAGVCLPLSSFYYRWDPLRLSWAALTTSESATSTTKTPPQPQQGQQQQPQQQQQQQRQQQPHQQQQ